MSQPRGGSLSDIAEAGSIPACIEFEPFVKGELGNSCWTNRMAAIRINYSAMP